MKIPLPLHSYRRASATVGGARLVNCFAESAPPEGKSASVLLRGPGIQERTSVSAGKGRGIVAWKGALYAVIGSTVYKIAGNHNATSIGGVGGSAPCTFAFNSDELIICSPPYAYVYDGSAFSQITDADFRLPAGVAGVDGYAVFIERNSDVLYCSDLNDASSFDPLYYANVEGLPGNLVGIIADHRQLILAKSNCCEMWEDVGGTGFPFARSVNGFMELGCASGSTLVKADNSVYMLASDRTFRRLNGLTWVKVSHPGVEEAIRRYTVSDAFAFSYTQDGHIFIVLTFPSDDATWVLDVTTNEWHERESNNGRWRPNGSAECYGRVYVQRYDTGAVCSLEPDVYTDCGDTMAVEWTYGPVYKDNNRRYHSMLECVMETGNGMDQDGTGTSAYIYGYFGGFGTGVDTTREPQVLLSVSNDGGRRWLNVDTRSLGRIGERDTRVRWWQLGSSPDRRYRMRVTDAVKVVVTDTQLEVK